MTSLIFRPAVKLPTPDAENSEGLSDSRLSRRLSLRIFGERVRHVVR